MSIKFNGLLSEVITFTSGSSIKKGNPVKMSSNGRVSSASMSSQIVGIATNHSNGLQGVMIRGYAELPYTGSAPALGFNKLCANGGGGVMLDSTSGRDILVVSVDTSAMKVGIILGV